MLKKLNHIAIVVPDIKKAKEAYVNNFGAKVSEPKSYPEHGVTVIFVELDNTKNEKDKLQELVRLAINNKEVPNHHVVKKTN